MTQPDAVWMARERCTSAQRGANASVVSLLFEIALIGVLLHPQSRQYQRTWFKFR